MKKKTGLIVFDNGRSVADSLCKSVVLIQNAKEVFVCKLIQLCLFFFFPEPPTVKRYL